MELLTPILIFIFAYIFGSIPYALVIGKVFFNTDIRTKGSGNLGGTNAGRVLGKWAGISVSVLDTSKAFIVIMLAWYLKLDPVLIAIAGLIAAIGHCYPIFANFKGGKAVSTAFGFLLGISIMIGKPLELFLIPAICFFIILKLTKFVSFSSMCSVSIAVVIIFIIQSNVQISLILLLIDLLVIYRHRANIKRLIKGTESKVKWL